jgi:hypothetical protein
MVDNEDWKKERACETTGCTHAATTGLSLCVRCRTLGLLAASRLVDERLIAEAQAKLPIERAPAIERAVQEAFVAMGRVRVAVLAALDAPTVTRPEGDGVVRTFGQGPEGVHHA